MNFANRIPKHIWVAATGWFSRIASASINLLSIRYLLRELGVEGYSAFALLGALLAWSVLADFGVGYSLQNHWSERRAAGRGSGDLLLASALLLIPAAAICMFALYWLSPLLANQYLQGVTITLTDAERARVFFLAGSLFIATSVGGVAYKLLFAEQLGWVAHLMPTIGTLIGFALILVVDVSKQPFPLYSAVGLFYGPPALVAMVTFVYCMKHYARPDARRGGEDISRAGKIIARRAVGFFAFAAVSAVVLQADYMVMSQRLGSYDVVVYTLLTRAFGPAWFIYMALLQAIWPVCAELRVKGEWDSLRTLPYRYIGIGVVGVIVFCAALAIFRETLVHMASADVTVPLSTIALFGVYFIMRVWTDTYGVMLQSMNVLRPFWILVPIQACLSFGLQWYLSGIFGINGLLMGLMLSFLMTVTFGLPAVFYRTVQKLSSA
ncbi:MATE family efflux transporter [Pandoraea apista]|uniref:MATE family efflux transporter n=1 Tax=Pandoraea apista TaxID=93218 RepID=UPI0012E24CBF|nr:MATE family efflux transporter [Pandoraea apista]